MRKLIKVIAVPVLCCIILCILFFMVDFRSNGEEVSVPRAIDVRKTEPAIAVWQEEKEAVPIAIEETEELTEIIEEMSKEDVELIALVTMAEAEGECEEGKRLVIDTILNRVDSEHFPDTVYEVIYQPNQFSSMWNGRVDRCEVREDICGLVYEELESRTNYDVRSLHNSDRRLDVISRTIRKQQKFNNGVAVFSVLVTMNFFIGEIERQEQAAKIKKLESKIEELKRDKGE